ncbi:spermatogenesis-associated protein 46 [Rhinatrema bivittatum]|uniref:spermatogenesis-associated protein 46 n=1 Tax=Rhinatrema bivittatum TaxID=194408 RepID=UPI00112B6970|nr:spermatogenesis-associated protein 46 [Rhinatrema bivittatum]
MESFSLLTISGPLIQNSAVTLPRKNSFSVFTTPIKDLTGIPNVAAASEEIGSNQHNLDATDLTLYSKGQGSSLSTMQSQDSTRINCSIYRPWFSPYSYYACTGKESLLDSCSSQGTSIDDVREVAGDAAGLLEISKSAPSNSSSFGSPCPNASQWNLESVLDSKDSISPQDILAASKWFPEQQSGYKCVACCRMFPTLHSLQSHIRHGFREGFSCRVFYRKIKTFWERDNVQKTTDESSSEMEQFSPPN